MNKKRRALLATFAGVWFFFVISGSLGYIFGFEGSAILYDRWPGFFIGVGVAAIVMLGMGGLLLILAAIFDWVQKGKSDEAVREDAPTGTTVRQHYSTPTASLSTIIRGSAENAVQSEVSGNSKLEPEHLTRRILRERTNARVIG